MAIVSTVSALAVVGVLAYAGLWLLRRMQSGAWNAPGPFKLHATHALGARERVVLLEVTDRLLVLGVTSQRIDLLLELPKFDPGQGVAGSAKVTGPHPGIASS
jgi:flagellar protein FliO/FliZ